MPRGRAGARHNRGCCSCPSYRASASGDTRLFSKLLPPGRVLPFFVPRESRPGWAVGGGRGSSRIYGREQRSAQTPKLLHGELQTCSSTFPRGFRGLGTREKRHQSPTHPPERDKSFPNRNPAGRGNSRARFVRGAGTGARSEPQQRRRRAGRIPAHTCADTRVPHAGLSRAGGSRQLGSIPYRNRSGPRIPRMRGFCSRPAGKGRRQRDPRTR